MKLEEITIVQWQEQVVSKWDGSSVLATLSNPPPLLSPRSRVKAEGGAFDDVMSKVDAWFKEAIDTSNYWVIKGISFTLYALTIEALEKVVRAKDATAIEIASGMKLRDDHRAMLPNLAWKLVQERETGACMALLAIPFVHNDVSYLDMMSWAALTGGRDIARCIAVSCGLEQLQHVFLLHMRAARIQRAWRARASKARALDATIPPPPCSNAWMDYIINSRIISYDLTRGTASDYFFLSHSLRTDADWGMHHILKTSRTRFIVVAYIEMDEGTYGSVLYKHIDVEGGCMAAVFPWLSDPPECFSTDFKRVLLLCFFEDGKAWHHNNTWGCVASMETWPDESSIDERLPEFVAGREM
jgi:hypothetical protein